MKPLQFLFPMTRRLVVFVLFAALASGQTAPYVSKVTNAAISALDPPASVALAPRSMATIFGVQLADSVLSAAPPWQSSLGGVEVHLVASSFSTYDPQQGVTGRFPATDDFIAPLIYVSPTQINFVVPDVDPSGIWSTRLVIVKNGVRFDNLFNSISGTGLITIYPTDYKLIYGIGYDCLFSFSLTDSGACGLSWTQGQHRAMVGAITDATSGQLITAQNPIHQNQLITIWLTGLVGMNRDSKTGLLQKRTPPTFAFGVAQNGKDLPGTVSPGEFGEYGQFVTVPSLWAGESPEYMGLDQANVNFPVCTSTTKATTEKRYDAFLTYTRTNTTVRVYLPFVVRVGDPDCQWVVPPISTATTLSSSLNPSGLGKAVTLTATVSPSAATGTVTFMDGSVSLGTSNLSGGRSTLSTYALPLGNHSLTAIYGGDTIYGGSTSSGLIQTVSNQTMTTTTLSSESTYGGIILKAVVVPSTASGTLTFIDNESSIGSVVLASRPACVTGNNGQCVDLKIGLGAGSHSITANYSGNSDYVGSVSLPVRPTGTTTTLTASANPCVSGQPIVLTATVSPSNATGSLFFVTPSPQAKPGDIPPVMPIECYRSPDGSLQYNPLSNGTSTCPVLCTGASFVALYSGNSNYGGSMSATVTQTVAH